MAWLATETDPASSGTDQLYILVGGIIVAAVTAAGTVLVAIINARGSRTAPAPPSPAAGQLDAAEIRRRLDDGDEGRELLDRRQERHERAMDRFGDRLERVENHLDRDDPGWRNENRP